MLQAFCEQAPSRHGYAINDPVIIAVDVSDEETITAQGCVPATIFYAASLGKQVTAACAAIACTRGQLDVEEPIARWLPELPDWGSRVKVRHLIHHIGAIPHIDTWQSKASAYTNDAILAALTQCPHLEGQPGIDYRYSGT